MRDKSFCIEREALIRDGFFMGMCGTFITLKDHKSSYYEELYTHLSFTPIFVMEEDDLYFESILQFSLDIDKVISDSCRIIEKVTDIRGKVNNFLRPSIRNNIILIKTQGEIPVPKTPTSKQCVYEVSPVFNKQMGCDINPYFVEWIKEQKYYYFKFYVEMGYEIGDICHFQNYFSIPENNICIMIRKPSVGRLIISDIIDTDYTMLLEAPDYWDY